MALAATVKEWARRRPAKALLLGASSRSGLRVVWIPGTKGSPGGRLMLVLTNAQKVTLSVEALDSYGNPARIDGAPVWSQSDASVGTITPAADGLTAEFVTSGAIGLTQVSVQGDADLGSGVRPLTATLDVTVEASEAVALGIKAGVPGPK